MRRNRVWVTCHHCSKTLEVIKAREHTFRYCSNVCHGKAVLAKIDPKKIRRRRGPENNNWKGGRRKHTNGYVYVLFEGKYVLEHRHVMQQHLGRILSRREQVHHINGEKLDNRIENLEVVDIAEHARLHSTISQWSRSFIYCIKCKSVDVKHKAKGLCNKCYRWDSYQKERGHKIVNIMGEGIR